MCNEWILSSIHRSDRVFTMAANMFTNTAFLIYTFLFQSCCCSAGRIEWMWCCIDNSSFNLNNFSLCGWFCFYMNWMLNHGNIYRHTETGEQNERKNSMLTRYCGCDRFVRSLQKHNKLNALVLCTMEDTKHKTITQKTHTQSQSINYIDAKLQKWFFLSRPTFFIVLEILKLIPQSFNSIFV